MVERGVLGFPKHNLAPSQNTLVGTTAFQLSRQMAAFEEDLGITLFIRSGKKISLTDEGILLKRRALDILNSNLIFILKNLFLYRSYFLTTQELKFCFFRNIPL